MKQKVIFIGGILIIAIGFGVFAIFKWSGAASSGDEDDAPMENVPSIVSVQTGVLKRMTLHRYVSGYGIIEATPATKNESAAGAQLTAPIAGVVAKINVVDGQHVKKGDVLVELNSGAMTFDYAQAEVARQKKLFAQQNTSLKSLEDAQAQLASLEIVAPISGTVTRISEKVGEAVDANKIVAEVIDLNRLAVSTKIPEAQAGELKPGEEVQILTQSPVTTSLSFISSTIDSDDGTISAWAALPQNSGLRPGQFVQLNVVTAIHTNVLAAPEQSIVTDGKNQSSVAIVQGDEAIQTPVKIGLRENGWVEIEGTNLNENNSVVTMGAYGLPEKTKIQIVNSADEATEINSSHAQ